VILKVPVPGWIAAAWVITNARALQLAEIHGLAAPRLIAADLDGRESGTVATLETFLSGNADPPPTASVAHLREAGAAIAKVHAFSMEPESDLPHRPRPCAVDDRAAERRRGLMPTTPLLKQADERVRSHGVPAAALVFVHGDVWGGNMPWEGDRCVALIDWNTAGVGEGQIPWPPVGSFVDRRRAATWPPLGRISWPPAGSYCLGIPWLRATVTRFRIVEPRSGPLDGPVGKLPKTRELPAADMRVVTAMEWPKVTALLPG